MFAKNKSEIKYKLMLWKEALKKRNINIEKNKNYDIGWRGTCRNGSGGYKLEQVKSFKYLGAQIQNNGKQEAEINEGILHAEQKFLKD